MATRLAVLLLACAALAIGPDREFVPYVSVIQTGTAVALRDRDAILHHVHSFPPAPDRQKY